MTLAEKIRKFWVDRGRTQSELAALIGVRPQRMSLWMNGTGAPEPSYLLRMARVVGVPVEYLADDSAEGLPPPTITDDERYIVQLMRDLRVSREEAANALAAVGRPPAFISNAAAPTKAGKPDPEPDGRAARKKGR